jgi:hypothetical protein
VNGALRITCPLDWCDRSVAITGIYEHLAGHDLSPDEAVWIGNRALERDGLTRQDIEYEKLEAGRARMRAWTLESFPACDPAGRNALQAMLDWIAGEGKRRRVYLDGPTGSDKSGLAYGAARRWVDDGGEIEFENMPTLLATQRARFSRGEALAIDHLLDPEKLVVLDDLGDERPTSWAVETTAYIVERLHAMDVRLIVTTNYVPRDLAERLGHEDRVIGERVVDRLLEDAIRIRLDRPSLRTYGPPQDHETGRGPEGRSTP